LRITGLGQTTSVSGAGRKKTSAAGGFSAALDLDETTAAAATVNAMPVTALGLLALQEAPTATASRSKGVARAEELLDQLNEIRRGLLAGVLPAGQLQGLLTSVRDRKLTTDDPRLNGLLEEIELRAAVELAKLGIFPN
jgi:hypothetical protein